MSSLRSYSSSSFAVPSSSVPSYLSESLNAFALKSLPHATPVSSFLPLSKSLDSCLTSKPLSPFSPYCSSWFALPPRSISPSSSVASKSYASVLKSLPRSSAPSLPEPLVSSSVSEPLSFDCSSWLALPPRSISPSSSVASKSYASVLKSLPCPSAPSFSPLPEPLDACSVSEPLSTDCSSCYCPSIFACCKIYGGGDESNIVIGSTFKTFSVFQNCLRVWCAKYFHPVKICRSEIRDRDSVDHRYFKVVYTCVHAGKNPVKICNVRPNQFHFGSNCPMKIKVVFIQKPHFHYRISDIDINHNHVIGEEYLNHTLLYDV